MIRVIYKFIQKMLKFYNWNINIQLNGKKRKNLELIK